MFRPLLDVFIDGFFINPKIKAETKLTVVMWFQICDGKSLVPSSGDFGRRPPPGQACEQDQELTKLNIFSKLLVRLLPRSRPELPRGSMMVFFISFPTWVFAGLAAGVHHYKSDSNLFYFPIVSLLKHHGDLWSTGKSCVQTSAVTEIFSL